MKAPQAKKNQRTITQHGRTRNDDYAWLRDKNWKSITEGNLEFENQDILDYINAENKFKDEVMSDYKDIEKTSTMRSYRGLKKILSPILSKKGLTSIIQKRRKVKIIQFFAVKKTVSKTKKKYISTLIKRPKTVIFISLDQQKLIRTIVI